MTSPFTQYKKLKLRVKLWGFSSLLKKKDGIATATAMEQYLDKKQGIKFSSEMTGQLSQYLRTTDLSQDSSISIEITLLLFMTICKKYSQLSMLIATAKKSRGSQVMGVEASYFSQILSELIDSQYLLDALLNHSLTFDELVMPNQVKFCGTTAKSLIKMKGRLKKLEAIEEKMQISDPSASLLNLLKSMPLVGQPEEVSQKSQPGHAAPTAYEADDTPKTSPSI